MDALILNLDDSLKESLYIQIYDELKSRILSGDIPEGTRLPSLRAFSEENGVSLTTAQTAYNQLLVEGYIESRPKSGYYVSPQVSEAAGGASVNGGGQDISALEAILAEDVSKIYSDQVDPERRTLLYDAESFDFSKWKKCMNRVFSEYSHLLRTEADAQGEEGLRYEIAKYLCMSRGVKCKPEQVVIGAGSQALTAQLVRVLREMGIDHAATETPGYPPIKDIFRDEGFSISETPVGESGIVIEKLPTNLRSVVYVSPSNQFPTGAVMPIRRRYELLKWASDNDSYILEDDYDSELRYFGKPIPAMKGLDGEERVIYMGSFSATLFASVKINYMILPTELMQAYEKIKMRYSQTCSKAEQLCLALYMENGYFYRHIKKCRKANAAKLAIVMRSFSENGGDDITAVDSRSGLGLIIKVKTSANNRSGRAKSAEELCAIAKGLGLAMRPVDEYCTDEEKVLYFYFYRVSAALLQILCKMFISKARA